MTVSRANAAELPEIIDVVVDNETDVFAFARHCPEGPGFRGEQLTPAEYMNLLKACWYKFREHEGYGTAFNLEATCGPRSSTRRA